AGAGLSAPRPRREPVGRRARDGRELSRQPRRLSEAVPCRGPEAAHALAALVPRRRLQLPAPGPLRRACVPLADGGAPVGTGTRFRRRRARAHRAAAKLTVAA